MDTIGDTVSGIGGGIAIIVVAIFAVLFCIMLAKEQFKKK